MLIDFLGKATKKRVFLIGVFLIAPNLYASRLRRSASGGEAQASFFSPFRPSNKTEGSLPLQKRRKKIEERLPGELPNDALGQQQFQEILLAEESKNEEARALQYMPVREEMGVAEASEGGHLAPDFRCTQ